MKQFRITYQDKALNKRRIIVEADSWTDAICEAFKFKMAKEKLLTIEFVGGGDE